MKLVIRILMILSIVATLGAVERNSQVAALRVVSPPVIDAVLDEAIWQTAVPATDFATLFPENRLTARLKNRVWFAYDDANLYVAAEMEAASADSILRQLGERDNENVTADWFGIWISAYNDKANDIVFRVTAAGVQLDHKSGPNYQDDSWDPVWRSAVQIHDQGWTVEFAIPFSQIRFPAKDVQVWGLNMARWVQATREVFTWTFIEKDHSNWSFFEGELVGIQNVDVPLRLSFTPYAATSFEHYPFDEEGKSNWSRSIRGGMDLKYGINESFTLDLTLIPDFGEVQSDNEVLNLSPFEIRYDERRPFFTEGTDLLTKAGRFYSRRVGDRPIRYDEAYDLADVDSVLENPDESQMINATKITGQTESGLGIALFNAMTAPMYATILDTLGGTYDYMTSPFVNFNRMVISKNFGVGSQIAISNSYTYRGDNPDEDEFDNDFRDANVTAFRSRIVDRNSKWSLSTSAAYSQIFKGDSTATGYEWNADVAERDGAVRYGLGTNTESDTYDPNDLGYMNANNEFTQFGWLEYILHEPRGPLVEGRVELELINQHLYKPRKFVSSFAEVDWNMTFRNYFSTGGGIFWRPQYEYDYHEARVDGQPFLMPPRAHIHVWVSSNYNKPFAAEGWIGTDNTDKRGQRWYGGGYGPRWRVNDQVSISLNGEIHNQKSEHGFADWDDNDNPVFGRRDRREITNTISSSYTLSKDLTTSLRVRHYWSQVVYSDFYDLLPDGSLAERSWDGEEDGVFNSFTVDAVMVWRFAPGSELNLVWKNAVSEWTEGVHTHQYANGMHADYLHDLTNILNEDQSNSISLKLLYYVDWWSIKNRLSR